MIRNSYVFVENLLYGLLGKFKKGDMQINKSNSSADLIWEMALVVGALASLLEQQGRNPEYSHHHMLGLGILFSALSEELAEIEKQLRN